MKIRRWSYSLLSAGILLLSVSHPVVAQMSRQDWEDQQRRQEEEEWYWHDRMMRQLKQEPQQQPLGSVREEAKVCFELMIRNYPNTQAWGLSGLISAYCTAGVKGDFNTAWINLKPKLMMQS